MVRSLSYGILSASVLALSGATLQAQPHYPYPPIDPINAYFGLALANQFGAFPNQGQNGPAPAPSMKQPAPAGSGRINTLLGEAGVPVGEQQWPLGLRILPGSAPYRERIESLFRAGAAQAAAGQVNPLLPAQIKQAVRDFERYLRQDKNNRMSLTWSMYDQGESFLRRLERAPQVLQAMASPAATNPYLPGPSATTNR